MKKPVYSFVAIFVVILSLALAACSSTPQPMPTAEPIDGGESEEGGESEAEGEGEEEGETAVGPPAVTLQLGVEGDKLAFDTNTLEATLAEGEVLAVQLNNTSQSRAHSFVLLNTTDMEQAEAYVLAAAEAGTDQFFVPTNDQAMAELIIGEQIYTEPGETGEAAFVAPPPGDYLFVSSVPGSFAAGMHGTLTIKSP